MHGRVQQCSAHTDTILDGNTNTNTCIPFEYNINFLKRKNEEMIEMDDKRRQSFENSWERQNKIQSSSYERAHKRARIFNVHVF